jgi:catechol 2,3-dioxygenase
MAMTGVLRPGHISLRVLDLEEGINFYKNTLGLVETGRDGQGRVYFKAWDEREHNSVLIREAESAGVDFFAFKVADKATLDKLDADLQAFGLKTERIPAGEMLETGERVRFEVPSGHLIELYAEKTDIGNGQSYVNPDPWIPDAERGIAPSRMDHCLLYGPDIEKVQEIFEKVLGFYLVEHVVMEDGKTDLAIWLSCSTKAHDIAMVRHPEPGKLHHVSLQARQLGEGAARGGHHVDAPRVDRHRPDPPRHHPRHHDLCLRPLGQPLRDLLRRLRHLPRLQDHHVDLGRGGRRDLLSRPQAQRALPERGVLTAAAPALPADRAGAPVGAQAG